MKAIFSILIYLSCMACCRGESVSICGVPTKLPIGTSYGSYSPPICFDYSGLSPGQTYVLTVWLLAPANWYCASSQWCERMFPIDNTTGLNGEGTIEVVAPMDVYSYSQFDWVVRLYNQNANQVAFAELPVAGTYNHPPMLATIPDQVAGVRQTVRLQLSASDQDGNNVSYGALSLFPGAQLDSTTGQFVWTPQAVGTNSIIFTATDDGDGTLVDAQQVTFAVVDVPQILVQPQSLVVPAGTKSAKFNVLATNGASIRYQWQFNRSNINGATSPTLIVQPVTQAKAGAYRVQVQSTAGSIVSQEAVLEVYTNHTAAQSRQLSLTFLRNQMDLYHNRLPVYDDISSGGNHFVTLAQLPNDDSTVGMDMASTNHPHSGATSIQCLFEAGNNNWGGFYLENGILAGRAPLPYFGESIVPGTNIVITNFTGLNLSGATTLTFWARGENGNEQVEFFMGGVGWNPNTNRKETPFADSASRSPKLGTLFKLTKTWKQYSLNLTGLKLTNIMGGFGWTADAAHNPKGAIFYLDDIQYNLNATALNQRLNSPRFIRSFVTLSLQPGNPEAELTGNFDYIFRNTAFTYDNAVALLAFLADGSVDSIRRARLIGDAFVYAANHDRTYTDGRMRTAYSCGDITLFPGWLANGRANTVPISGFYDTPSGSYYESAENLDIDTGNNAWTMIALLALYDKTHATNYLNTAKNIGYFIRTFRSDTGLYQGFRGGIWNAESTNASYRTYGSTEHNLDIYPPFKRMGLITGDPGWGDGAEHARQFAAAMWDNVKGCYLAGTDEGAPDQRNDSVGQLPLDTQSWSVLSLTNALALHPQLLSNAESVHLCSFDGFTGYDFNDDRDGVWFEGTSQMAVAYAFAGQKTKANAITGVLRIAQQIPSPIGDGMGIIAASHDGVSSGFNFDYFRRLHVGATAWNIFAQMGFNPYYQKLAP